MTVRALVVDDSVVVRRTVANVLDEADGIEVVGTATDGRMGLRKIEELNPDVVTLDVEMPGMNGLETLREIRRERPELPVIMYSTLTERGAEATLEALSLGAVDYATKPSGATTREQAADQIRTNLLPLVRLWGQRKLSPRPVRGVSSAPGRVEATATIKAVSSAPVTGDVTSAFAAATAPQSHEIRLDSAPPGPVDAIVIGVSTGGPDALARFLPMLPGDLPVPVAIVQHMPPVFTAMLAKRLDQVSALSVREATDGEALRPGSVYLAPGGRHLEVSAAQWGLKATLTDGLPENSCRPAVDVLFRTATRATAGRLLAVVLTGMGQDGMLGSRLVRQAGGTVLAQDEQSSVVWGMPGFVARDGVARAVLPLEDLPGAVVQLAALHSTVRRAVGQ